MPYLLQSGLCLAKVWYCARSSSAVPAAGRSGGCAVPLVECAGLVQAIVQDQHSYARNRTLHVRQLASLWQMHS